MREGLSVLSSLALIATLGCAPSVRQVRTVDIASRDGAAASDASSGEAGSAKAPAPPEALPPPTLAPVTRADLEGGPHVCVSNRPDLARSLASVELGHGLPPEELHLLRRWLQSAIGEKLGDLTITWDVPACAGSFLCLSGPAGAAEELGNAIVDALSDPESAAFYRVRLDALASAEEWDRSDASWKLNTAARALRAESPGTARLAHLQEVDDAAWKSVVERYSGAKKEKSLPLYVLQKDLTSALRSSTLILSSPSLVPSSVSAWQARGRAPAADPPAAPSLVDAPDAPVRLDGDTPDVAQAILLWELGQDAPTELVESALALLVHRWRARETQSLRVWVQTSGRLYALPALRVDGAYEDVRAVISELQEEYDRLVSTYGSPSEAEWEAAELNPTRSRHFEERCARSNDERTAVERMTAARQTLRRAGSPTVVIWGSETPPTASE